VFVRLTLPDARQPVVIGLRAKTLVLFLLIWLHYQMMKTIIIYGTGCTRCQRTERLVRRVAAGMGMNAIITKEENIQAIIAAGVMATPAVAIDGAILSSGCIPRAEEAQRWLAES
jgi:small redox-active disulfide protein 2